MLLAEISLFKVISWTTYGALAAIALWGLYCIVVVWTRVNQKRFTTEDQQDQFLDAVEEMLKDGRFDDTVQFCHGDTRAIPQIIEMAVENRKFGYKAVRQFVIDRFQRDVMNDLEYRLSWVATVIKSAPMIGLFGTVFGMMGAFKTLATAESVNATVLAEDINIALRTTACGLAIAIPLMILVANVNIRISKMEDLVGSGAARFMSAFRKSIGNVVDLDSADAEAAALAEAMRTPIHGK